MGEKIVRKGEVSNAQYAMLWQLCMAPQLSTMFPGRFQQLVRFSYTLACVLDLHMCHVTNIGEF